MYVVPYLKNIRKTRSTDHRRKSSRSKHAYWKVLVLACLCGSLAQCALSLKRLSAGPGFNPQTRLN